MAVRGGSGTPHAVSSPSSAPRDVVDPTHASSTTHLRVRFCETDLMGIVHHASYLAYFEAGRVEWLRARGVTYATWAAEGSHLAVVEASLKYRAPARFDDLIEVETILAEVSAATVTIRYVLRRGETTLAEGSTKLACVDDGGRLRRVTPEMRAVLLSAPLSPSAT